MLTGLRHRTIGGSHHENGTVHLRRTSNHIFDVVGMARAIDVSIVTDSRLIFHVRNRNGDATSAFFRRIVNLIKAGKISPALQRQRLGDRSRQRGLPMINVPDCPHVNMGLRPLKYCFGHDDFSFRITKFSNNFTKIKLRNAENFTHLGVSADAADALPKI